MGKVHNPAIPNVAHPFYFPEKLVWRSDRDANIEGPEYVMSLVF
jgi:hypothetical protein